MEGVLTDNLTPDDISVLENSIDPRDDTPQEKAIKTRIKRGSSKLAKKEAEETAIILLSLLDGIALMLFGPEAALNDFERELISDPLQRIMQRLDFQVTDKLNTWVDPIMLTMGLIAWGNRIIQLSKENKKEKETRQETRQETPQAPKETPQETPTKAPRDYTAQLLAEQLTAPSEIKNLIASEGIDL